MQCLLSLAFVWCLEWHILVELKLQIFTYCTNKQRITVNLIQPYHPSCACFSSSFPSSAPALLVHHEQETEPLPHSPSWQELCLEETLVTHLQCTDSQIFRGKTEEWNLTYRRNAFKISASGHTKAVSILYETLDYSSLQFEAFLSVGVHLLCAITRVEEVGCQDYRQVTAIHLILCTPVIKQ